MPPSRYEAWLEQLPEFDPETDSGIAVVVQPIEGTTGVVSVFDGPAKTVARLRPYDANLVYRVTDNGRMRTVTRISTAIIIEQMAPGWTSAGNINLPGATTDIVQFKISQPLPD